MNDLDKHLDAYQGKFIYEFDNQIQMNWYPKRILNFTKAECSVLELGLGHGITTNYFSEYYEKYVVIDASKAVIENFRKSFPKSNAKIIEGYFEEFDTVEKYDVIIVGFIMEHVDDPDKILEYYKRFLKTDGKIFITVPNAEVMNRRLGYITGDLPDIKMLSDHDKICGHKRYYSVKSLTEQILSHGYTIRRIEGIYLKPLSTAQMISLKLDQAYINALCQLGIQYPELCCGIFVELTLN